MLSSGNGTTLTHAPPFRSLYQIFKKLLLLSYHKDPLIGFGGGETLTYTGAEVGVETACAVQVVPVHFQVLPLLVYSCPTDGFGGKDAAIFIRHLSLDFYPVATVPTVSYIVPSNISRVSFKSVVS